MLLKHDPATHPMHMLGRPASQITAGSFHSGKKPRKSLNSIQPLNVLNTKTETNTPNAQKSEERPTPRTDWN